MHIFKISFLTKFTFSKSHFSQNSHLQSLIFDKIHILKLTSKIHRIPGKLRIIVAFLIFRMTTRRLEASPLLVTKSCTLNSSATPTRAATPSTFSAPFRSSNRWLVIEGAFYRLHHAMISYFRRFSIHYYYTTIINTTLDQDMNFFLPSIANIKEKNDAVSRRANSFGISTLLAFHILPQIWTKARRVSLKTANSK